jgi:hypothetical protein
MSHDPAQPSPGQLSEGQRRKTWPHKAAASLRTAKKFWRYRSPKRDPDASSTLSRLSSRIRKPSLASDMQTTTELPIEEEHRAQQGRTTKRIVTREISNDTVEILLPGKSERAPAKEKPSPQKQQSANLMSPVSSTHPSSFLATDRGNGAGMFPLGRKAPTASSVQANTTIPERAGTHFPTEQEVIGQDDLDELRRAELEHVLELRRLVWNLRSEVHVVWADVRRKQSQAKHMMGQGTLCEDAQESCYLLQDKCEELQNELTRQEKNLSECERRYERFYSQPGNFRRYIPSRETSPDSSSHSDSIHSDGASDSDDDDDDDGLDHPLVAKLFSMQRDMDRRQELLNDLVEDRKALLRERDSKFQKEKVLSAKNQEQLSSYEMQIDKLLEGMRALGEELDLLRQDCLKKELIDEYGDPVE